MRRFMLAAAAVMALGLTAAPARAQALRVPGGGGTLNPYNYYDPYGYSRQAAFNIGLYGRAMSQVPPYALGYNPYVYSYSYYPSYAPGYYEAPYVSYATPYYPSGYSYYWYSAPSYYYGYQGGWRWHRRR